MKFACIFYLIFTMHLKTKQEFQDNVTAMH